MVSAEGPDLLGQRRAWVLRAAVQDDTPLTGWLPPVPELGVQAAPGK